MRKLVTITAAAALLAGGVAEARKGDGKQGKRPQTIALPAGWQPEGIAAKGNQLYAGSLANGAIYTVDTKGRKGRVLYAGRQGRNANGIQVAGRNLLVAGGRSGQLYVYDRKTGREVGAYDVDGTFVNDVAILGKTAYFTDSEQPVLHTLPKKGTGTPGRVPITGDLQYVPEGLDANGIVATKGTLITVQSATGKLFTIDPQTGVSKQIDLGGAVLTNGDGLLIKGRTLYVVQNRLNKIAVVALSEDLATGRVVREITDPDFAVPTTIARAAGALYAVNAKFGTPPTPETPYEIVRVGAASSPRGSNAVGEDR